MADSRLRVNAAEILQRYTKPITRSSNLPIKPPRPRRATDKHARYPGAVYQIGDDGEIIWWCQDGYQRCEAHSSFTWCTDIEFAVKEGLDAETLWSNILSTSQKLQHIIQVPIVPSCRIWQAVVLEPMQIGQTETNNAAEILYHFLDGEEFTPGLGYLNPGEGLRVLREVIIDYYRGILEDRGSFTCRDGSHGFTQQMAYEASLDGENGPGKLAEKISIVLTNKCTACNATNAGIDFADLVPPDQTKRKW